MIADLQVIGAQNQLPTATGNLEAQVHGAYIDIRHGELRVAHHAFQTFASTARLGGVLAVYKAVDVIFLLFDVFLLGFVLRQAALVAFLALLQIGGVVATIFLDGGGHFPNEMSGLVQKIAIMRDDNCRAIPAAQPGFQPFHRLDVEMVGGLIQEQKVGVFEEQFCQARASALATRKLAQGSMKIVLVKAETSQSLLQAVGIGVASGEIKARLQAPIIVEELRCVIASGHAFFQFLEL